MVTFTAADDDDDHSPCTQFTQRSRPHHQLSAVKERKADGGLSEKGKTSSRFREKCDDKFASVGVGKVCAFLEPCTNLLAPF